MTIYILEELTFFIPSVCDKDASFNVGLEDPLETVHLQTKEISTHGKNGCFAGWTLCECIPLRPLSSPDCIIKSPEVSKPGFGNGIPTLLSPADGYGGHSDLILEMFSFQIGKLPSD